MRLQTFYTTMTIFKNLFIFTSFIFILNIFLHLQRSTNYIIVRFAPVLTFFVEQSLNMRVNHIRDQIYEWHNHAVYYVMNICSVLIKTVGVGYFWEFLKVKYKCLTWAALKPENKDDNVPPEMMQLCPRMEVHYQN